MNKNSLFILIAETTNNNIEEVEDLYELEIKQFYERVENLEGQNSLHEIISLIDSIFHQIFNRKRAISTFVEYQGWVKVEKVFLTIEELDEINEPSFRQEIKLVKEKLQKSITPALLQKYLYRNENQVHYRSTPNDLHFHYGSYTDAYPINRKQWDVVGNVEKVDLLSVNGPPGTGKTTLLKEIIADQLVKKTKDLISIWDEKWDLINKGTKRQIFQSPLGGENLHSIIITSTNNKAVDNIGKELLEEIPYLNKYIKHNLQIEAGFRGLLCARLGKKENVDFFKNRMVRLLIEELKKDEEQVKEDFLDEFKDTYQKLEDMENRIREYKRQRELLTKSQDITDISNVDIDYLYESMNSLLEELKIKKEKTLAERITIENDRNKLSQQMKSVSRENDVILTKIEEREKDQKELYLALDQFDKGKKFSFLSFFSSKHKEFYQKYPTKRYIEDKIDFVNKELTIMTQKLTQFHEQKCSLEKKQEENDQILLDTINELHHIQKQEELLCNKYDITQSLLKCKNELEQDLECSIEDGIGIYQLVNSPVILRLRKKLFDLSLVIHEEYIKKHKEVIIANLEKIVEGNRWFSSFYDPKQQFKDDFTMGLKGLWETLFMCFPVVSTTLHSFHSNNFQMVEGLFDVILVDEAGQILPHYLVGPLYRARKAVVVGDVYQLEPIRLQRNSLIEKYDQFDVDTQELLCIEKNSVQSYSDDRSDLFDKLEDKKIGIILEEHRRCEESIAHFSNKYVYNSKLQVVKKDNHQKLFGRNLVAFDVRGPQSNENTNEMEVIICKKLIDRYIQVYGEAYKKDIAIITPFKNQAERLKQAIKGVDIGTVHTFQGQEKKVILISTVVDQAKKSNLTGFVGRTANLLNVAFTRGKEQIVFVGNVEMALQSNNYLKDAIDTIKERGFIYSIYDNELNINKLGLQLEKAFKIFVDDWKNVSSPIGTYLNQHFSNGIIIGANKHYEFLLEAFHKAEKSITIVSPWITNYVVDEPFIELVEKALAKKVKVNILFGYHQSIFTLRDMEKIVQLDYKNHKDPREVYTSLLRMYDLLGNQLIYRPPTHTKLILIDNKFLIVGSHNWLSNKGNRVNAKEEVSCILSDAKHINYINDTMFKKQHLDKTVVNG
ncbi:AAA domain-containing protein [Risungbinella massiliensis]|uniref:AAA domain-containing protein n=1 Tax=Risungbinella massiliensis TaxID=1329796 RepID=UPI00164D19FC|nr:AAA domain-containing protein [Risungbinella massiliensis]